MVAGSAAAPVLDADEANVCCFTLWGVGGGSAVFRAGLFDRRWLRAALASGLGGLLAGGMSGRTTDKRAAGGRDLCLDVCVCVWFVLVSRVVLIVYVVFCVWCFVAWQLGASA